MKYLSLFTGIGGFELGIQQAYENETVDRNTRQVYSISGRKRTKYSRGIHNSQTDSKMVKNNIGTYPTCIGYSEIDKYAIQIYEKHFKHKNYGDITKIDERGLPDFELLCGGFPCQSFSIAGKRGGFEDTRGTLFFDIARIAKYKRPRIILLENVKGLLSHEEGRTFNTIISTLDELGYDLQWQVLNSKNFGVPQNRERVFIIGHLRGTPRPQVFPFGETNQIPNEKKPSVSRGISVDSTERYKPNNQSELLQNGKNRLLCIRRLTPTECERLQGFPDGWTEEVSDTQRYKTLGNAVTVNVIAAVVKKLL